tara:strand:- start:393 stop:1550 length:1158 start_codon:yes stop_codon:yes gene_type:complete
MSAYPPPKENLPIYNPRDFEYENFPLTINDARDFFLEYPTAQGAETLSSIVVNGSSTFNDVATINDSLDISQPTPALNALNIQNDNPGVSIIATSKNSQSVAGLLTMNGSSIANKENPIVEDGDSVISTSIANNDDTGGLTLTQKSSTNDTGIRIAGNRVNIFPGITFPDGTNQTTASTSTPAMLYPTMWVQSNGNQLLQSSLSGAGGTATIQLPYSKYTTTGSFATTLTLEIKYTITFAVNEYNWVATSFPSEQVYYGYWLGTIFIQPIFPTNAQVLTTITDIGNMFQSQTISSSGNVSKTGFTPIAIDWNTQTDLSTLDIVFGDCEVPLASGNNVGMTSFNRSVRIVDNIAINPTSGDNAISTMTLPNSNVAQVPVGAYFTPY